MSAMSCRALYSDVADTENRRDIRTNLSSRALRRRRHARLARRSGGAARAGRARARLLSSRASRHASGAQRDCSDGRIAITLGEGPCTVASESRSRSSAWRLKYTALWLARGATVACAGMRSAVVTLQSQVPDNARRNPAAQALTGNRRLVQPATAKALEGVPGLLPAVGVVHEHVRPRRADLD